MEQLFTGFGGALLVAQVRGAPDDPPVLLLHAPGQDQTLWLNTAAALAAAGRQAITLALGDDMAAGAADVRMVLGQLRQRPVIVAAGDTSGIALGAVAGEIPLASGIVLVDHAADTVAKVDDGIPLLIVSGAHAKSDVIVQPSGSGEWQLIEPGRESDRVEIFNALLLEFLERRVPRAAPEYRSGSDARTLRDALGCFATGVTVVTCLDAGGAPIGLTANSFTSVSLDPPLLLVCIANRATSLAAFQSADRFAVNVLHIGQQPTSNRFASRIEDRFADTPWEPGEFGSPVLLGSLASFECSRSSLQTGGDHAILIGEVLKARFEPRRDPLLYFRGKYRRLHFS